MASRVVVLESRLGHHRTWATIRAMTYASRRKLSIPKFLAVSVLGLAPGCGDDDTGDTGNDSGPATTSATTSATEGSATAADETAADETAAATAGTMGATSDTGGALPDCQAIAEVDECENTMSCVFIAELYGCIVDCDIVDDQQTCDEEVGCIWYGDEDGCGFEPIA